MYVYLHLRIFCSSKRLNRDTFEQSFSIYAIPECPQYNTCFYKETRIYNLSLCLVSYILLVNNFVIEFVAFQDKNLKLEILLI